MAPKRKSARKASRQATPVKSSTTAQQARPARAAKRLASDAAARVATGLDTEAQARRLADRSAIEAREGFKDLDEGAALAGISEDISALSGAARALSLDEVQRGMDLAAMAGQIGTVGEALQVRGMRSLGNFLEEMSRRLRDMAVRDIIQAQGTRGLAETIGRAGADVEALGEDELATGVAELAAAQADANASDAIGAVAEAEIEEGLKEAADAEAPPSGGTVAPTRKNGEKAVPAGNKTKR